MSRRDDLRQMAKIAELYHQRGLKQAVISERLGIHQSTISRLLKRAEQEGLVRITLHHPAGFYPDLETALEARFGLDQAVVVDGAGSESELLTHLGSATAALLSATLKKSDVLGISSWSSSLLAMVDALEPLRVEGVTVVQILGGVGEPSAEAHATHLTQRLAQRTGSRPVLLPAPGVVRSAEARAVLEDEPYVRQATDLFPKLSIALVGIGAVEPSPLLADSGNVFRADELESLRRRGAAGDICLRFFDEDGRPISSALDDQVIGASLGELKKAPRVIGVAGGARKERAVHAALKGGLVNVLVTDHSVAQAIVQEAA